MQREPGTTFCGVPFCGIDELDADVAVFGAPHGTPYQPDTRSHAASGADSVRQALSWYSTGTEQMDFDSIHPVFAGARVVDLGNVTDNLEDGRVNRENIELTTRSVLDKKAVPILLGGDDSIPIPFIQGLDDVYKEITVVQVDAHIDWRDEVEGVTQGFSSTMRRASEMDHVKNIIQIGARGPGSARLTTDRECGFRRTCRSRVSLVSPCLILPEGRSISFSTAGRIAAKAVPTLLR